jgi:hypothetical protein
MLTTSRFSFDACVFHLCQSGWKEFIFFGNGKIDQKASRARVKEFHGFHKYIE